MLINRCLSKCLGALPDLADLLDPLELALGPDPAPRAWAQLPRRVAILRHLVIGGQEVLGIHQLLMGTQDVIVQLCQAQQDVIVQLSSSAVLSIEVAPGQTLLIRKL